jgi:hypothetical protein
MIRTLAIAIVLMVCLPSLHGSDSRRVFALTQLDGPIEALLEHEGTDGVALQMAWTALETSDDAYNWTALDAALAKAKRYGKTVTLHGFCGISPWLKTAGVQTYTFIDFQGKSREEAVPWDAVYLTKFEEFLSALRAHVDDVGALQTIASISVTMPVAEMDLIACRNGVLAPGVFYDRATYLASWRRMIAAYQAAFPTTRKYISAPVGLICYPERDLEFYRDVMTYAEETGGSTSVPFAADLTSEGSDRMSSYPDLVARGGFGLQTIWSATNDSFNRFKGHYPENLRTAVCIAVTQGAESIEIYAIDVLNPETAIQKAIHIVHDPSQCRQGKRRAVRQ